MNIKNTIWFLLITVLLFGGSSGYAQKRIKHKSETLSGFRKDGISYLALTGNVRFEHLGTIFLCDSAVLEKKNNHIDAYGNITILDGDSITITSKELHYSGTTRIARLRKNVHLTKLNQVDLYTDYLDYYRNGSVAKYFNNGKVVDKTNVLTSNKGYFYSRTNFAAFKTKVIGENEDYTLNADTLVYNTQSGIAYFVAPTKLTSKENNDQFTYSEGEYYTKSRRSELEEGNIETESYFLKGDKMHLDDFKGKYTVIGDVQLTAKENDVIITGGRATHDKSTATTKIFDGALMRMLAGQDTLYIRGDTLVSIDSKVESNKRLLAYNNAKVFKSDLQSSSDSLAYNLADSVINFYQSPVIWANENQMTADTINIEIKNAMIDKMTMKVNTFVVFQDSLKNHNQIKGRDLIAHFENQDLELVNIYGNGESIFFMYEEETSVLMGMNRILCSDIRLDFKEKQLIDAHFLQNPEGKFIPPHELKEEDRKLNGFVWRANERPTLENITSTDNDIIEVEEIAPGPDVRVPSKPIKRLMIDAQEFISEDK